MSEDQQSLAIGKGGQNVRLAAKLTGWKIDIKGVGGVDLEKRERKQPEIKEKEVEEVVEETPKSEDTETSNIEETEKTEE